MLKECPDRTAQSAARAFHDIWTVKCTRAVSLMMNINYTVTPCCSFCVPGCGQNYHKRCAVKVPSNCVSGAAGGGGGGGVRRASASPRSPSRASTHSHASHASHDDSLVRRLADLVTGKD